MYHHAHLHFIIQKQMQPVPLVNRANNHVYNACLKHYVYLVLLGINIQTIYVQAHVLLAHILTLVSMIAQIVH